jgi:hypothetical protein
MVVDVRGAMMTLRMKMSAIRATGSRETRVTLLEGERHLVLLGNIGVVGYGAALRRRCHDGLLEHLIICLFLVALHGIPSGQSFVRRWDSIVEAVWLLGLSCALFLHALDWIELIFERRSL